MKFLQSICVAIFLLALPLLLGAEPVSQLHSTDYINDVELLNAPDVSPWRRGARTENIVALDGTVPKRLDVIGDAMLLTYVMQAIGAAGRGHVTLDFVDMV